MGVPGFYLWLMKNYRKTKFNFNKLKLDPELDKELLKQVNNLDYLLIDTNCLLHPVCFDTIREKPDFTNYDNMHKKMMENILEYLDKIISFVNPKKGVYIAIDGVAPVAKMKQQRSRRFKSVYDNNLFNNIKKKHKRDINTFWNNSAISPGTEFMKELDLKIQNWSKEYSSKNKIEILYSSCYTPSEGEHKLLQFIRDNEKQGKKYSYITYGLDADLIFLMLATGIKDTFLLREADQLDNKISSKHLEYVSINTMRNAIIASVNKLLNLNQDIVHDGEKIQLCESNIIDDFIFICYLLGNDFLPHLPSLDIYDNGIGYLLKIYVDTLEYCNYNFLINRKDDNMINQEFFNKFIGSIASDEEHILQKNYNKKKRRRHCHSTDPYDMEMHKIENLQFRIEDPIQLGKDSFEEYRERYYKHYFHLDEDEIDMFAQDIVEHYMRGLKWVTKYYFDDCPAWKWYFPYDNPPFLTDMNKFKVNFSTIKFEKGEPLSQLEQLLCILPPQSNYLLPRPLRKITINGNSSIRYMYPINFELDYLYKKKYWMCLPKLPDLEVQNVQKIFKKYKSKLNQEEQSLNLKKSVHLF